MAKTTIEVDLRINGSDTVAQVEQKTKSLKGQLREMKELLASGTLDNNAFNKLSAEAGALQDQIGDVNQRVKNLASDAKNLDAFVSLTQGIVGGFAAVQGITALVGDENEDLQKTMVKLQGAMAAMNGLQALANTLNKDSAIFTTLQTIKLRVLNFVEAQRAAALQYTTVAMQRTALAARALGAAIAATGVGALIVGIGLLIPKIIEWTGATKDQKEAQDKLNESLDVEQEWIENELKLNDFYTKKAIEKAKQRGATEAEINEIEAKGRQKNIDTLDKLDKDLERQIKEHDVYRYDTAKASSEALNTLSKKKGEAYAKLEDLRNADELARESAKTKAIEKQREDAEKRKEQKDADKLKADAKYAKMVADQAEAAEKDRQMALSEKLDAEIEAKEEGNKRIIKVDTKLAEEQLFIIKKKRDAELQAEKEKEEAKLSILNSYSAAAISAGEALVGEGFKQTAAGKIIALSQIATDTALAISSLVKNSQANPANAPTSGLAGAVQFAAGIAQITANIANARRILVGGGTPSAAGGGGGSSVGNSQPPPIQGFIPQQRQDVKGSQRVYVLEKDITDTQGRVARIRTNATLM